MAYNKAKEMLKAKARQLLSKAAQKRREADRLETEAAELTKQSNKLD